MKNNELVRLLAAILVLCGVCVAAIQYSDKLGKEKLAEMEAQSAWEEVQAKSRLSAMAFASQQSMEEAKKQAEEEAAQRKAEREAAQKAQEIQNFIAAPVCYPDSTPAQIQELYDYYRSNYSNVVGYIYSPYTVINYPILRGTTVNDFYLSHDINGNDDVNGCIVLEPLNSSSFSDDNTILYGHNMRSGAMFASLCGYKNSSYYSSHPYMYILTPTQNYRLDLWAGIVCPHDDPVFATAHDSSARQSFYNRSTFRTSLGAPEGRMVTLCTCSYEANNYRYCVLGRLVEIS